MALKCECGGEIRKTIDNKDECIICGNTKKGGGKMAQIPEQTYAEIAEPFGKQFRDAIREAYARGYADGLKKSKAISILEGAVKCLSEGDSCEIGFEVSYREVFE